MRLVTPRNAVVNAFTSARVHCTVSHAKYPIVNRYLVRNVSLRVSGAQNAGKQPADEAEKQNKQQKFKHVSEAERGCCVSAIARKAIKTLLPPEFAKLKIPWTYHTGRAAAMAITKLMFKLANNPNYVQPGLLSEAEQQRLAGMELGSLIAEVAATSMQHRNRASRRVIQKDILPTQSRYIGVRKRANSALWDMNFNSQVDGKARNKFGTFETEEEAARAYDKWAWQRDSWVAILNFPEECGLPVPQPSPAYRTPERTPQPCPTICKHVTWHGRDALWRSSPTRKAKFKENGVMIPSTFLFQQEVIRAERMMSLCLFGDEGEGHCLLSTEERQRLHTVHNTLRQNYSYNGKLVPELVRTCEPLNRVVAEIYATSSKHRRHAARCAVGKYTGIEQVPSGKWKAQICRNSVITNLGTFEGKKAAAEAFDDAAFEFDGWCVCCCLV